MRPSLLRRFLVALGGIAAIAGLGAAAPAQAQNRFWLENNTGRTIEQAYISPSRLSNWGPDVLGDSVLNSGQRVHVTPSFGDCVLDVRVVFAAGGEEERRNMNACTLSRVAFGGGAGATVTGQPSGQPGRGDPSFKFINAGTGVVRELYVSLSTVSNWGSDRLGQNMLNPGQSVWVPMPSGSCSVDVRVVYDGGGASERRRIETCSVNEIRYR